MSQRDEAIMLLRFGVFELDRNAGELRRQGRLVALTGQPLRVLDLLASNMGRIVTRDELQRAIWGDETHVDFEAGLSTCVNQVRSALKDSAASPRFVETLPRRGYRFIAPVEHVNGSERPQQFASSSNAPAAAVVTRPAERRSRWLALGVLTSVAVIATIAAAYRAPHPAPSPIHIAVLPVGFEPTRPDLEALSSTFTDALIGAMTTEAGLRARIASPLAVRDLSKTTTTDEALRKLGTEYYVYVELRSLGEQILVHAKLVHINGWLRWTSDRAFAFDQLEREQLLVTAELSRQISREILPLPSSRD